MKTMKKWIALALAAALMCSAALAEEEKTQLEQKAEAFKESASGLWGAFLDLAGTAADEAGEFLGSAADRAGEYLESAAAWAGERYRELSAKVDQWLEQLPGWIEQTEAFFAEKSAAVSQEVSQAWTVLREAAKEAGSHTQEEIDKAAQAVKAWIGEVGGDAGDDFVEAVEGVAETASARLEVLKETVEAAEAALAEADGAPEDAWATLKESALEPGSHSAEDIRAAYEALKDWFGGESAQTLDAVKDAALAGADADE